MYVFDSFNVYNSNLPTKLHPIDGGMSFINHNSDAYEETNFDPKKPLVMYSAEANKSED